MLKSGVIELASSVPAASRMHRLHAASLLSGVEKGSNNPGCASTRPLRQARPAIDTIPVRDRRTLCANRRATIHIPLRGNVVSRSGGIQNRRGRAGTASILPPCGSKTRRSGSRCLPELPSPPVRHRPRVALCRPRPCSPRRLPRARPACSPLLRTAGLRCDFPASGFPPTWVDLSRAASCVYSPL